MSAHENHHEIDPDELWSDEVPDWATAIDADGNPIPSPQLPETEDPEDVEPWGEEDDEMRELFAIRLDLDRSDPVGALRVLTRVSTQDRHVRLHTRGRLGELLQEVQDTPGDHLALESRQRHRRFGQAHIGPCGQFLVELSDPQGRVERFWRAGGTGEWDLDQTLEILWNWVVLEFRRGDHRTELWHRGIDG